VSFFFLPFRSEENEEEEKEEKKKKNSPGVEPLFDARGVLCQVQAR
jgi:hypothetical protein